MATATAAATVTDATPPARGKKKLIIIIGVVVLVLAVAAVAALLLLKKKPLDAEGDLEAPAHATVKHDPKHTPVFVPLDPFTVNLADREAERYAQVGITLEIEDNQVGDQIKAFMPAIRNNILMLIADRTAADLQGREGKLELADKIRREASRALGYASAEEGEVAADAGTAARRKKKAAPDLPVKAVHFSNFIIQ